MLEIVDEFIADLSLLFDGESLIFAFVAPAVAPAIPIVEPRAAAEAHALIHRFSEHGVAGFSQYTVAKSAVGFESLCFGAALPISDVVLQAAVAPIFVSDE